MTKEDADSLFEKNSVQELQIILQNLKYRKVTRLDAEKKKYELRNHVGESYRDVIEAADAIGMMKTSAIGLIERFEKAKGLCLVQQHDKKKESTEQTSLFRIAAQIRLLVITPEQVWSSLELGKFLIASRLYLIAEAAYLDLVQNNEDVQLKKFPVYKRQWEVIKPLKEQIVQKAMDVMRLSSSSFSVTMSALSAICVLQHATITDTFHILLDQKRDYIMHLLSLKDTTVLDICKDVIGVVFSTISLVEKVFISQDEPCSLEKNLNSILSIGSESGGSIAQFYSENSNMSFLFRFIPISVRQHATKVNFISTMQNENCFEYLHTWISSLGPSVQQRLVVVLKRITIGSELAHVASKTFSFISKELSSADSQILSRFYKSDIQLWLGFMHTSFLERSNQIIAKSFEQMMKSSQILLDQKLKDGFEQDHDVSSYVWSQKVTFDQSKHSVVDLETPTVVSILQAITFTSAHVIEDVIPLIRFFLEKETKYANELEKGTEKLLFSMYDGAINAIQTFQDQLRNRLDAINKEDSDHDTKITKAVFVGRIAQFLKNSLERFFASLDVSKHVAISNPLKDSIPKLDNLKKGYEVLYLDCTSSFVKMISTREYFNRFLSNTQWSTATTSEIQLVLSPFVADYLFRVVKTMNRYFGLGIEPELLAKVIGQIFVDIVDIFHSFLEKDQDDVLRIHENRAQQLYFDFDCLTRILKPAQVSVKESMKQEETARKIMEFLPSQNKQELISNLEENVSRHIIKSSTIYGSLLIFNPPPVEQRRASVQEKHHVIQMAPSVPRFVLLPITAPTVSIRKSTSNRPSAVKSGMNRVKPSPLMKLKPMKSSMSDVPLGISHGTRTSATQQSTSRVQGIMNAMAQKTSTTDIFSNATSYFSGVWGSASPKESPKRK